MKKMERRYAILPINELETVLRKHALLYPQMQPTDAVKLIYQNEFGPGHFASDLQKALEYLKAEHSATPYTPTQNSYEDIGNGLVRVHLSAIQISDLKALNEAFVSTANAHKGTLPAFLEKLEILKSLTAQGIFVFEKEELQSYLQDYSKAGYPPVSHSQTYKDLYYPAYRVVYKNFIK